MTREPTEGWARPSTAHRHSHFHFWLIDGTPPAFTYIPLCNSPSIRHRQPDWSRRPIYSERLNRLCVFCLRRGARPSSPALDGPINFRERRTVEEWERLSASNPYLAPLLAKYPSYFSLSPTMRRAAWLSFYASEVKKSG